MFPLQLLLRHPNDVLHLEPTPLTVQLLLASWFDQNYIHFTHHSCISVLESVQELAKIKNFLSFQIRIVANIVPVKMDVLHFWVLFVFPLGHDPLEIGLPKLVATAGTSPAKFNPGLAHRLFHCIPEFGIGFLEHKVKSIITAALNIKVGPVFLRNNIFQEQCKILYAPDIILIQELELAPSKD